MYRDAAKKSSSKSRIAKESLKWISWTEYLDVVERIRCDLEVLVKKCAEANHCNFSSIFSGNTIGESQIIDLRKMGSSESSARLNGSVKVKLFRKAALKYQQYLLLAFFASIPDRQRTFRELIPDQTLFKSSIDDAMNMGGESCYLVKHGPNDYKTGKTYGDRPPLVLDARLTVHIDYYLGYWRQFLNPKCDNLFVQARSGQPISSNGVYRTVARACYEKKGKKTNPHLLRDMLVTHVRGSDASEKQLEALALYMGHSIQMQRASYDRRT